MSHFLKAWIVRDEQRPTLFYVELENPILGQDSLWERVGPMSLEEAITRQKEHTSIPNFAAQMEQTPHLSEACKNYPQDANPRVPSSAQETD